MSWTNNQSKTSQKLESLFSLNSIQYQNSLPEFPGSQLNPKTIAFVDATVFDPMTVMAEVQADIKVLLDPTRDGIGQITDILGNYRNLTGIGIISHGTVAALQLGSSSLSKNSLDRYAGSLQQWGQSLDPNGDILLYGCNVATGETGQAFINNLSNLTGADVAASTDITGNSLNGGNWALEYTTGSIETATPFTSSFMSTYQGVLDSIFGLSATPSQLNVTDGSGSEGDYELGMEFRSSAAGQISAIKYYKAASETGTHVGKIWSSSGQLLASVTFTNETASGWQEQALPSPLNLAANQTYVVSVNANSHYAITSNGIVNTITNGPLSAVADGSNGVFNSNPGSFPTQSWNNSNYFRDVVFITSTPVNNTPGTVTISGTAQEDQTLTATVADTDGLTGVTINYQWQQSSDSGSNWSNIAGATASTLSLGDNQVNKQVRVTATYTDAAGSSENLTSSATAAVSNINDIGTVAIDGLTAIGNTLTANVSDADGLSGATINYQWQKLENNTWSNLAGATNQNLTLDNSLVGKQIRVNAIYTDALGGSEDRSSAASNPISASSPVSIFSPTLTPSQTNLTDGSGSAGDYELGMEFKSNTAGQISAVKYYKAASETGTHTGKIWSSSGQLLASVTFTNETASGWQEQALPSPLNLAANQTYVVSVNANSHYAITSNGIVNTITNGPLSAVADGSNGVFNSNPGSFPTQSWNNSNYFRDVVFITSTPVNNTPGTVTISGTAQEDQTLTATVADTDGLTGVTINYQWQQSSDSGSNWSNIAGATASTLSLGDNQVNKQVRVTATYTDAAGSSENLTSSATAAVSNINDIGTVAIDGLTAIGNTLTANVSDADGLSGATINYQWQKLENNTWSNLAGATNQNLTLDNSLVGKQIRVNAIYTDALGGSEDRSSAASNPISASSPVSIFSPTLTPSQTNLTDGSGSAGDYELGTEFRSSAAGQISAIKYYKSPSETGTHTGKIWSSSGQLLASVTFTNETASGWQEQALPSPLNLAANQTYVVSVNANSHYVTTSNGIVNTITNGPLSAVADGSNGVFNSNPGSFPTQSWNNSNYFRDVVFITSTPVNNTPGTIAVTGNTTEDQTLTATVADTDGLTGVTVNYLWQQSIDGINWNDIHVARTKTLTLSDGFVNKQLRVKASYTDTAGNIENIFSAATAPVTNINDPGVAMLKGSPTAGHTLMATAIDNDGMTGVTVNYQWQESTDNGSTWSSITGATAQSLQLDNSLLGKQVRATTTYTDAHNTVESVSTSGTTVTAQNPIVLENQKPGTSNWEITNLAKNNEIAGYATATSINKGEALPIKVSLAQAGQYSMDVYRLGYYGGAGARLVTSVSGLNGVNQGGPTIVDPNTKLVEYQWGVSHTLQTNSDWTSGLYMAKLTDSSTGKQNYVQFVVRDDNRPTDLGFQDAITTAAAYNNTGGYSVYDFNSANGHRAYQVSFDRPYGYNSDSNPEQFNNVMTWEYNMARWVESQGYDVSYYTNLDVATNPLQLYSQKTFLSVGHDEYWSMEMRNNVEKARDNGINLGFFSANTAYWRVRFDPSSTGEANRVMTVYKEDWALDPVAQNDPSQATTQFRSDPINRPENALLGVMYTGDIGADDVYAGFDYTVTNASDPYYTNTGFSNGDKLTGLVGYEWDTVLNAVGFCCQECAQGSAVVDNGCTPEGLIVLSQSAVQPQGGLPPLPEGANIYISNSVRYTVPSGAQVFSSGSVQWVWGLDSHGVANPRTDPRAQQMAVNILGNMGAKPRTPSSGLVVV